MAKLTLTDLAAGYLSATAFNANNALIEAALENTVSRDGTAPNTMSADFDMNSNNVNNVNTLTASGVVTTTLTLNGEAITTTTTLTGGLAASEVTYDGGTLQDKLDNEFPTIAGAETISGTWTFSGAPTFSALATFDDVTVGGRLNMGSTGDTDEYMGFGIRTANDGDLNKKIAWEDTSNWGGYDFLIQAGLQYGFEHARTGDGHCGIGMISDVLDGRMDIFASSDGLYTAGDPVTSHGLELSLITSDIGGVGNGNVFSFKVNDSSKLIITDDWSTLNDYQEGTYTAALTAASGTITLTSTVDLLSYTKVGRLVTINGRLQVASVSTPSGNVTMNLPFSLASTDEGSEGFAVPVYCENLVNDADGLALILQRTTAGSSTAQFETADNGADTGAEFQASTLLVFSFSYFTDE